VLERRGVEVRLDCPVEQVDADGVVANGERIVADTVIWTAGVAATEAGDWLGAETDKSGRVKVEADLSLPGHAEVFVVGDAALALDEDGEPLPGLAAVARQQVRHVGRLLGALAEGPRTGRLSATATGGSSRPSAAMRRWPISAASN
jgi:NADH dehydrogenase